MIKFNSLILYSSYTILDLETAYGMDLNLSVCFESSGNCEIEIQVFKETKLAKPTCNWTKDFAVKGLQNFLGLILAREFSKSIDVTVSGHCF